MAWQLYLPQEWADDPERRAKAGVPPELGFATKTEIALQQLRQLLEDGAPRHCVLADAGYGVDTAFRQALTDMGLQPISVKDLARALPDSSYQAISWREGTNETLSDRFAAVRVRHAGGNAGKARLRPEQWLLIEWPLGQVEPMKYFLATLPAGITLNELVSAAHQRWRIERDHQDIKQDFGFGHYEGRGWRGFHHHASLCIAAYGFLMAERLTAGKTSAGKKNLALRQVPAVPNDYITRGSPACAATRGDLHHIATPQPEL